MPQKRTRRNRRAAVEEQSCVLFSIAAQKRAAVEEAFLLRRVLLRGRRSRRSLRQPQLAESIAEVVNITPQQKRFYTTRNIMTITPLMGDHKIITANLSDIKPQPKVTERRSRKNYSKSSLLDQLKTYSYNHAPLIFVLRLTLVTNIPHQTIYISIM